MSAPFPGERLGLARPLPGSVHVKIQTGMAHPVLLSLKFGQILFFCNPATPVHGARAKFADK